MSEAKPDHLVHDAIRPSRGGVPGETAFLTAWRELMEAPGDDPLLEVHSGRWAPSPDADQADATMAATLVQWLGTNAGACLIQQARSLQASGLCGPDAFRAAWAIRNARRRGINSGLRSIEIMMVPPDAPRDFEGLPRHAPKVTVRQHETAEHVCAWLGTEAGADFLAARERELDAYREHEQARHREANRTGVRSPLDASAPAMADFFGMLRKAVAGAGTRRGAA